MLYFSLRSYRDGGEHYDGQIGAEPTPQAFLEALWTVMAECWRVLKPTGSVFVNLGDKRSGYAGKNWGQGRDFTGDGRSEAVVPLTGPVSAPHVWGIRNKSKMLLPHRFAIGCEDGLADPEGKGWVLRADLVWSKLNGLPESVTDRCRDSHEYVFHLTKQERYFSAVDEVREPSGPSKPSGANALRGQGTIRPRGVSDPDEYNPLGKLPGSVWTLASEPLVLSDEIKAHYDLPDHFAAFPTELVRRIVLGWSPSGVCVACGEGRRPIAAHTAEWAAYKKANGLGDYMADGKRDIQALGARRSQTTVAIPEGPKHTITGYTCACPDDSAPTRPSVCLDPFSGTGTTVGVARALGRIGIGLDLSHDYCRLGRWFVERSSRFAKVSARTNSERQGALFMEATHA